MGSSTRSGSAACAVILMFCAAALSAGAQTGANEGTVTGTGTASIERLPDVLRMHVNVPGEGKDAREAMANLKSQEKAAREKLAKLGAATEAVKTEAVRVVSAGGGGGNDRQAMIERMIRARTGRAPQEANAAAAAAPAVHVVATITAEWPLKAEGRDERIIEATDLQSKIKAASIVTPVAREMTPEEQEQAEERAAMNMDEDGSPAPGEPLFFFVSKLNDDDQAKAAAEAFGRAKADASRLANAAQAQLGTLRQLSSTTEAADEQNGGDNYFGNMMYGAMHRQRATSGDAAEAMGTQPGNVSYRVTVSASFAIKER